MKTLLTLAAMAFGMAAEAQTSALVVPTNPPPQVVREFWGAYTEGYDTGPESPRCWWTNPPCSIRWPAPPADEPWIIGTIIYAGPLGCGTNYTSSYFSTGTNCGYPFPTAQRVTIFTGGGEVIFCATNPAGNWFFQAHAMQDGRFTIDETPDLTVGMTSPATNALLMIVTNGALFTRSETIPK